MALLKALDYAYFSEGIRYVVNDCWDCYLLREKSSKGKARANQAFGHSTSFMMSESAHATDEKDKNHLKQCHDMKRNIVCGHRVQHPQDVRFAGIIMWTSQQLMKPAAKECHADAEDYSWWQKLMNNHWGQYDKLNWNGILLLRGKHR